MEANHLTTKSKESQNLWNLQVPVKAKLMEASHKATTQMVRRNKGVGIWTRERRKRQSRKWHKRLNQRIGSLDRVTNLLVRHQRAHNPINLMHQLVQVNLRSLRASHQPNLDNNLRVKANHQKVDLKAQVNNKIKLKLKHNLKIPVSNSNRNKSHNKK
jgi:hypothetical protein